MPMYTMECDGCGDIEQKVMTFAEHEEWREGQWVHHAVRSRRLVLCGFYRQVLDFHFNLGMREHYSDQLDMNVSSDRQFHSELARQQDEYSARMGFDVKFDTIDPNDAKAAGVTDAGLESQERAQHAVKSDGHKSVFS